MKLYKTILAVGVLVLLAVIGGVTFWSYRSSVINQKPTATQPATSAISFQDETITNNTAPYQISVTYPSVAGMDGFNSAVKTAVDSMVAQFKSDSMVNVALRRKYDAADYAKNPPTYSLNAGYDKGELDANVASVMLTEDEFTGGADEAHNVIPINDTVKTG